MPVDQLLIGGGVAFAHLQHEPDIRIEEFVALGGRSAVDQKRLPGRKIISHGELYRMPWTTGRLFF
jgi:hypothetical protein